VHASQQVLVLANHVQKVDVLAGEVNADPALARHGTGRIERAEQGMLDAVLAGEMSAGPALARHGTGRIEQADQAVSEQVAVVEATAYQEPTVPAGLPEIEALAAPAHLQWRSVGAPVRRFVH